MEQTEAYLKERLQELEYKYERTSNDEDTLNEMTQIKICLKEIGVKK